MALSLPGPTIVLAALAGLVALVTAIAHPPVDQGTVRSLLPWMAAGGLLRAIAPLVPRGGIVATLFTTPGPVLLTIVLLGVALLGGIAITRFTGTGDTAPFVLDWGLGLLVVLFFYVLVRVSSGSVDQLVTSTTALLASSVLAVIAFAILFRLSPAVLPRTDVTGIGAIWGHAVAVPIGIARPPAVPGPITRLAEALPASFPLEPSWLHAVSRVAGAGIVLLVVVRLVGTDGRAALAYLLLALLAALGVVPGVERIVATMLTA